MTAVEGLPAVHARLRRVTILDRDALKVIRQFDAPHTLFYLDPPYLHVTRSTLSEYGQQEMSDQQHVELLQLLLGLKAKVMLSGYPSRLYDQTLAGWQTVDFDLPNNSSFGENKDRMTERLWCNFKPYAHPDALPRQPAVEDETDHDAGALF